MDMLRPALPVASGPWMDQIFSAKIVARGGVVRRSSRWIEAEIGRDVFIRETRERGWHLAECNGQMVVFCTPRPVQLHF